MISRKSNRLTARMVEQFKRPGYYGDGDGLVLRVADSGSKVWLFRYKAQGRVREMGLGPIRDVSLAEAREGAREARRLRRTGMDPIDAKRERQAAARLDAAKMITFSQCAAAYIENHRVGWKNGKHAAQWEATLRVIQERASFEFWKSPNHPVALSYPPLTHRLSQKWFGALTPSLLTQMASPMDTSARS